MIAPPSIPEKLVRMDVIKGIREFFKACTKITLLSGIPLLRAIVMYSWQIASIMVVRAKRIRLTTDGISRVIIGKT